MIKNLHQLPNLLLSVNSASFYSNKNTVRPLTWGQSRAYAWKGAFGRALREGQTCSIALELLLLLFAYKVTVSVSSKPVTNHPRVVPSALGSPEKDVALRHSPQTPKQIWGCWIFARAFQDERCPSKALWAIPYLTPTHQQVQLYSSNHETSQPTPPKQEASQQFLPPCKHRWCFKHLSQPRFKIPQGHTAPTKAFLA